MAEDFTTYTEYDLHDDIEAAADKVDFVTYYGTRINRVYKDFGAGHFSGDFIHQVEVQYTDDGSRTQYGYPGGVTAWMLSTENSGRLQDIIDAGASAIGIRFSKPWNSHLERIYLFEIYGGVLYQADFVDPVAPDAPKYGRISRVGSTLTWTIYTDNTYSIVSTTRTLALHGTPSYRYVNVGGGVQEASYFCWITGFTQNLVLNLADPAVTTQAVTNIAATTAVGNLNIITLGSPAPTAHGVCWDTSPLPTIADDKTNEGAASATGPVTTTMTDLVSGTKYYVRGYVTTVNGTFYGDEVEFVAGGEVTLDAVSIEADVMSSKYSRGKEEELEGAGAGTLELRLKNADEKYTPLNESSELYGKLYPGKPIKFNYEGQTLFTGTLEKLVPHPRGSEQDAYMYVIDGFDFLSRARISTPLYPEYLTGAVVNVIADAAGWPAQNRVIDTGQTRYSYTIWLNEEALGALHAVENHEQGFVYIDHRGYLIFEDRNHRLRETRSKVSQASFDDDDIHNIEYEYGSARIYNRAEGERVNWTVPGVEAEIARLSGENPMIPYNEARAFWVEFDEITDTVITPVKGTDVDATTLAGGAGTDKNATLSVTLVQYAKGAKLIFSNDSTVDIYLSVPGSTSDGFKVRGEPFTKNAAIKIVEEDQASIDDHGVRTYQVPGTSFETIENLRQLCVRAVHRYKDPQGMVSMTLKNYSAAFLAVMLGLRISDRITVTSAKLHLSAEDFYINKLEHDMKNAGNTHTMKLMLARAIDEEFFIVGVSSLGVNTRLG